ncbi:PREDICTED: uncharacterized protein LOC108552823 [Eufriesea mexicana]|uniref:uncharacterized protein LOC108552823 n=1 Tax=Eufriesea mexicana TaxID=516756 RepID=UPI00083C4F5C|nr:PREDICTED: uncharacterized protein LOC108552823 [Eufriesea mexicana]
MANKENLLVQTEKLFETLLQEGNKYLFAMDDLRNKFRKDSFEFKKILSHIDSYSRCKTQLREDMEEFKEMYDYDTVDDIIDDDDTEEGDEMEYMQIEMEEYENEDEDLLLEEQFRQFRNIMYRKNILANMEMIILRMLNVDESFVNFQICVYSKLKVILKDYCQRVQAFLKRNEALLESQEDLEQNLIIKSIRDKYKQLQQLLIKLIEGQIFSLEFAV